MAQPVTAKAGPVLRAVAQRVGKFFQLRALPVVERRAVSRRTLGTRPSRHARPTQRRLRRPVIACIHVLDRLAARPRVHQKQHGPDDIIIDGQLFDF